MSVSGPNRSPSQTAINTASAAAEAAKTVGAAVTKGAEAVGKAVASAAGKVADSFGAAKPGAFEGIKGSAAGIMAGGCCFPPPTGPLQPAGGGALGGIGSAVEGMLLRMNRDAAKDKIDKSFDDATKTGSEKGQKISEGEQRKINSAGRDYKIADKKVDLHEAQQALKQALAEGKANTKATGELPEADQKKINDAQDKIDKLETQLKDMVSKDKFKDMIDNVLDGVDKAGSKPGPLGPLGPLGPGIKGPGGLPEPPGGKVWDEKLPPHLGGDGGKVPTNKLPDIPGGYGGGKIFDERPPIGPGGLFPPPDWKPFPKDFKLPDIKDIKLPDFKLPDFKLPDIKDLPFPKLPAFPQPPVWTCRPPMFETTKPPFLL